MYIKGTNEYVDEACVLAVILDYKEHYSNTKLRATDIIKTIGGF